jgi:monoamine oxidase
MAAPNEKLAESLDMLKALQEGGRRVFRSDDLSPGQSFTVRPALQKRFGRVFFAGEHIADWQGFMEGAVQTGYDAAKAILET